MCDVTTGAAARHILGLLAEAGAARTGDEILRLLTARGVPVCLDHAFTALYRLLGDGKIEVPGRVGDESLEEDLRGVPFTLHREGETPVLDGRWKLLGELSRGGMSVIYRAEQVSLPGRVVVVKLLSLAHLDPQIREEVRTRFLREAGLIAKLNHPAAVMVLDQGVEGDRVYYVMEYLEGGTLSDRLAEKGGRLSWEEVLEIATQVTEALAAAARKGVLHRDLKPENIMYDGHGRLKIVDWGLAKVRPSDGARIEGPTEITRVDAIRGTPAYMAPERCEGRAGADNDERGDLYSLGMVLRRLLTGQDPYPIEPGQSHLAWLHHQVNTFPPSLATAVPAAPREFAELVDVCIRKRPEDRFQSFGALHAELRRLSSRLLRRTTKVVRPASTRAVSRTGLPPSKPGAAAGGPIRDTAILEFVDGLEFDAAAVSAELDSTFDYVAAKPDLLRAILKLAREKNAIRWAARIWAEAEAGREASAFEAAYEEAIRTLETGAEPERAALSVPLNLCELAWVALRRVHQAATIGELGDTTALEGLLVFLRDAAQDPSLSPWRIASPHAAPQPPPADPGPSLKELTAPTRQMPDASPLPRDPALAQFHPPEPSPATPPLTIFPKAGAIGGSVLLENRIGERHGDYRLKRYIGRGGTCDVYEAEDERLGRRAAVKILRPQPSDEEEFIARYVREARNAANLPPHPNLVPIYAALDDGQTRGIAMEYVEGTTLEKVLDDRSAPLPWSEALRTASEAAMGLAVAHQAGFIHRDVKPGNLMIDPTGRARVMDFGLLRRAQKPSDKETVTTLGIFVGTPQYASPEQCEGLELDARSDVFSLGVTLYEMLAGPGRRPFTAPTTLAQLRLISDPKVPAEPLRQKNAEVPLEVEALVHRMLAKRKEDRPPSMAAVVSEIEALLAALDDRALILRRARRRLSAAGVLALLGLAVLAYTLRPGKKPEAKPAEFEVARTPESGKSTETEPPKSDPSSAMKPTEEPKSTLTLPLPEKVPDVKSPGPGGPIPLSPPKPPTSAELLATHPPSKEELDLLDLLLRTSASTLAAREGYDIQVGLAKTLAFRAAREKDLTPWLLLFVDAEIERLRAGEKTFRGRPLVAPGPERTLVLRDGRTFQTKVLKTESDIVSLELPNGFREEIPLSGVSPASIPAATEKTLESILARSAAADAAGTLAHLETLGEIDRRRFGPLLLAQAMEETLHGVTARKAVKALAQLRIPDSIRALGEPALAARFKLFAAEQEAAQLFLRKVEDKAGFRRLFLEFPSTVTGRLASQETLATFQKAVDELRQPPGSPDPDHFEIGGSAAWGGWTKDMVDAPGGSIVPDHQKDTYTLAALEPSHRVRLRKQLKGAQKGYQVRWAYVGVPEESTLLSVSLNFKRWFEITPGAISLYRVDDKDAIVLSKRIDARAPIQGGLLSIIPLDEEDLVLVYLEGDLVASLPRPEYALADGLQLAAGGGTVILTSIRVLDRTRD